MVSLSKHTTTGPEDAVMKSPRDRMDILAAYRDLGSYRAAADLCGTTHKTVRRVIERQQQGPPPRAQRRHNTTVAVDVVREKIAATDGRISAKRLLPLARTAGYAGSARNFRRLVRAERDAWRRRRRVYRPWLPTPGEHLVIDWGQEGPLHIFSAVLVWSRVRFVRCALDERSATTLRLLAECFEAIGGVPAVVLADRMGCLRAGVVANVVVPHPEYVRFAAHFGFRPDFCEAHDPESKGVVENLVGYAKSDLVVPLAPDASVAEANAAATSMEPVNFNVSISWPTARAMFGTLFASALVVTLLAITYATVLTSGLDSLDPHHRCWRRGLSPFSELGALLT